MTRQDILSYVSNQYDTDPDYPWASTPDSAVLRHRSNKKWYGLIMTVSNKSLNLSGDGCTEVINLKCETSLIGNLLGQKGFLPAYHMNKEHWITILLNDSSLADEEIASLIDLSYELTK